MTNFCVIRGPGLPGTSSRTIRYSIFVPKKQFRAIGPLRSVLGRCVLEPPNYVSLDCFFDFFVLNLSMLFQFHKKRKLFLIPRQGMEYSLLLKLGLLGLSEL